MKTISPPFFLMLFRPKVFHRLNSLMREYLHDIPEQMWLSFYEIQTQMVFLSIVLGNLYESRTWKIQM